MTRHLNKAIPAVSLLALLAAASCMFAGQSQQAAPAPKEPRAAKSAKVTTENFPLNRVVVKVGGQAATAADVEYAGHFLPHEIQDEVRLEGRKPMGDQYVQMVTLTQEAAKHHLDDSPDFQRHMALARMQWLSQAEYHVLNDREKVTGDEVKQYYAAHQAAYTQLLIQEVSIRKKAAHADPAAPGLSEKDAQDKAGAIRHAIESGEEFSKVAAKFQQEGVIYFDPKPHLINHTSFPAKIDRELFSLKDGALSETFDNANAIYFVQALKRSQPGLSDVQQDIQTQLHARKIADAIASMEKRADVWMDPVYFAPLNPGEPPEHQAPGAGDSDMKKP